MTTAKPKKKPFPFHDGTVDENAPIRSIRMVKPECPIDPTPELRQRDGSYKANPRYTGERNCQQVYALNSQGVWDVAKCESLGHDPWHTVFYRNLVEDQYDEEGFLTGQKNKLVREVRLNIIQVFHSMRQTSGTEVMLAKARGCLTLDEYGQKHPDEWYASPCEFRNCVQPQRITTRFGRFCGERHARLVAADVRGILRFVRNEMDPHTGGQDNLQNEYEGRIEAIALGEKDIA